MCELHDQTWDEYGLCWQCEADPEGLFSEREFEAKTGFGLLEEDLDGEVPDTD